MAYTLIRGVDEHNFVLLDEEFHDSAWRIQYERFLDKWSVAHADSNDLGKVGLSLGYFETPEDAAAALERIAPSR